MAVVIDQLQTARCGQGTLGDNLTSVADQIERQRLLYDTKPNTDCSGIFHRAVAALGGRCPGSPMPGADARDTRAIARWYADRGRLLWIDEPLQKDQLIRPGAVLFFGQSGRRYAATDLGTPKMYARGQGIDHMGIVTRIERGSDGHVVRYWMLHGHGRKGQTAAGVTSTDYVDHDGKTKYNNQHRSYVSRSSGPMPPYGNWDQHWVAVAPVLEPTRLAAVPGGAGPILAMAPSAVTQGCAALE